MNTGTGTVTVCVQRRSAYGVVRIYPRCETARLLCALTGRKTFLPSDLGLLEALGYSVAWEPGQEIMHGTE